MTRSTLIWEIPSKHAASGGERDAGGKWAGLFSSEA
jgi:hypothetical protein